MALTRKPLSDVQRSNLEQWTQVYQAQLTEDDPAWEWLEDHRGLEWPTIDRFRLGVVRKPVTAEHEYLKDRVVIPNICQAGHVVGLKFGSLDPNIEPKRKYMYIKSYGTARLWNLDALNRCSTEIYVTEGEFKALALEDVGLPAIAVPGASCFGGKTREENEDPEEPPARRQGQFRRRIFDDLRVILVRDSDKGGEELVDAMPWVDRVVNPAPHKGIDDLRKAEGDGEMLRRLRG